MQQAANELFARMREVGLSSDGVLVAPMVHALHEVLLGAHRDPVFGPVVVIGAGGRYVEALPDFQILLPPFTADEASKAISRLAMAPLLGGVRGEPAAAVQAWAECAVQLGAALAEPSSKVVSIDANPVMLGAADGRAGARALVVDAVVILAAS